MNNCSFANVASLKEYCESSVVVSHLFLFREAIFEILFSETSSRDTQAGGVFNLKSAIKGMFYEFNSHQIIPPKRLYFRRIMRSFDGVDRERNNSCHVTQPAKHVFFLWTIHRSFVSAMYF